MNMIRKPPKFTFADINAAVLKLHSPGYVRSVRSRLEERLNIAFVGVPPELQESGKKKRKQGRQPRRDYQSRYEIAHANRTYLTALGINSHFFLPFVLVVSRREAREGKASNALLRNKKAEKCRLQLDADAKEVIKEIAESNSFKENQHYIALMKSLFPQGICHMSLL